MDTKPGNLSRIPEELRDSIFGISAIVFLILIPIYLQSIGFVSQMVQHGIGWTSSLANTGLTSIAGSISNIFQKTQWLVPVLILAYYQHMTLSDVGLTRRSVTKILFDCLVSLTPIIGLLLFLPPLILLVLNVNVTIDYGLSDFTMNPLFVFGPSQILTLTTIFLSCTITGIAEEFIFRAFLFEKLKVFISIGIVRVVLISLLFAMEHLYLGLGSTIAAFLIGTLFGLFYFKFRNLYALILAHTLVDFVFLVLYA